MEERLKIRNKIIESKTRETFNQIDNGANRQIDIENKIIKKDSFINSPKANFIIKHSISRENYQKKFTPNERQPVVNGEQNRELNSVKKEVETGQRGLILESKIEESNKKKKNTFSIDKRPAVNKPPSQSVARNNLKSASSERKILPVPANSTVLKNSPLKNKGKGDVMRDLKTEIGIKKNRSNCINGQKDLSKIILMGQRLNAQKTSTDSKNKEEGKGQNKKLSNSQAYSKKKLAIQEISYGSLIQKNTANIGSIQNYQSLQNDVPQLNKSHFPTKATKKKSSSKLKKKKKFVIIRNKAKLELKNAFKIIGHSEDSSLTRIVKFVLENTKRKGEKAKELKVMVNLDAFLDKGGFSQVYEGRILESGLKVAIKVIPYSKKYNVKYSTKNEILKEISFLKILENFPGSVNLIGYSKSKKKKVFFLIFEYFDTDLQKFFQLRQNDPLSVEAKMIIISQMVGILSFLQKNGILHRDLKPKNFLLNLPKSDSEIKLKICDFGVAIHSKDIKESFTVAGTKVYLAPEYRILTNSANEGDDAELKEKVNNAEKVDKLVDEEDTITISEEFTVKSSSSFNSDTFSLGLNIIYLIGKSIKKCNESREVLLLAINSIAQGDKGQYSPEMINILRRMLNWERDRRPDFIYLEDYFLYTMPPLRNIIRFKFDWKSRTEQYVSTSAFEEIKNISDKDKIFKYFLENGWKSTRMSTKFLEMIKMASNPKDSRFPDQLLKAIKNELNSYSIYEEILQKNFSPFDKLCKIYTVENKSGDSIYRILNQNIGFDNIENELSSVFLRNFLEFLPPQSTCYRPTSGKLYRGLPTSKENHDIAFKLRSEYLPGTYFYWTAFVSASKKENTAIEFLTKENSDQGILFIINIIDEKRKFDLENLSEFKSEAEVLLAPYFYFQVISNEPRFIQGKNICEIVIEEKRDKTMPFKVIWVDKGVKKPENQEICKKIRDLKFELKDCVLEKEAENSIKECGESNLFVISSVYISEKFLRFLDETKEVRAVGIFCEKADLDNKLLKDKTIKKLIMSAVDSSELISFLALLQRY